MAHKHSSLYGNGFDNVDIFGVRGIDLLLLMMMILFITIATVNYCCCC